MGVPQEVGFVGEGVEPAKKTLTQARTVCSTRHPRDAPSPAGRAYAAQGSPGGCAHAGRGVAPQLMQYGTYPLAYRTLPTLTVDPLR